MSPLELDIRLLGLCQRGLLWLSKQVGIRAREVSGACLLLTSLELFRTDFTFTAFMFLFSLVPWSIKRYWLESDNTDPAPWTVPAAYLRNLLLFTAAPLFILTILVKGAFDVTLLLMVLHFYADACGDGPDLKSNLREALEKLVSQPSPVPVRNS